MQQQATAELTRVLLRTGHGTFLSAQNDHSVKIESHVLDPETFDLEWNADGGDKKSFTLRSCAHGTYLSVTPSTGEEHKIILTAEKSGDAHFIVEENDGKKTIKSIGGLYLTNLDANDPSSVGTSTTSPTGDNRVYLEAYWLPQVPGHYLNSLVKEGYCVLPTLISRDLAVETKAHVAKFEASGQGMSTDVQHRIADLINLHPTFAYLTAHPLIVGLLRQFLGTTMRCATFSSNTLLPQDGSKDAGLGWHVDYPYHDVPLPWPPVELPLGAQVLWCLDDFRTENGGTMFQEKSHLLMRRPVYDYSTPPGSQVLECPAGSVLIAHSAWWHRQTKNVSNNTRTALLGNYTPGFVVPKDAMERQIGLLHKTSFAETDLTLRDRRVLERLCVGNVQRGLFTIDPPLGSDTDKFLFGGHSWDLYSGALKPKPTTASTTTTPSTKY